MDNQKLIGARADLPEPKNLIRSQYKDIMVKVDDDIYYLDRLQLALKSKYFEKLFIEDFSERNSDLIEIPMIDTDTFSTVVDIIYGADVHSSSVVNADNFIPVLMAMDYLQMDINRNTYRFLASYPLIYEKVLHKDVFTLYHFITENSNYEYLLPKVCQHLSDHIEQLQDRHEFLSIPFNHFIEIILRNHSYVCMYEDKKKCIPMNTMSEICAKWIRHDLQNRLTHMIDLVNAARSRFGIANDVSRKDLNLKLSATDEKANLDSISRKFYQLLTYCGEIERSKEDTRTSAFGKNKKKPRSNRYELIDVNSSDETERPFLRNDQSDHSEYSSDNSRRYDPKPKRDPSYREPKLETFLRNNNLYDITVKAGEKLYKLHRCVLKSHSLYFEDIFAEEYSEVSAQCEKEPPSPPGKDKIHFIDGIEPVIFDIIIDHMYLGKVKFTRDVIVSLFKAIHVLGVDSLMKKCRKWMKSNSKKICNKDVIEILNFTHAKDEYEDLNQLFLSKYIVNSWPKIENLPQFADLFKAIALPKEANSTDESKEYLFDKVDQETFKWIIDYIYLDRQKFKSNNIVRILKASELFKMEKLTEECVDWLIRWSKDVSSRDVVKVLRFARRNIGFEVLQTVYLIKHMMKWPRVKTSLFCPISFNCLQNLLMSESLYFDDPLIILDICAKWISYDIDNRYCLIPRIAFAISRNSLVDCDDYSIVIPPDWNECSLDFIKSKIREILSSTSVLPVTESSENQSKKRKTEQPVFIMAKNDGLFYILNSDWDEIVSFRLLNNVSGPSRGDVWLDVFLASAMINDNLFILCISERTSFFHVYSFSSGKLFSLASDPRIYKTKDGEKYGNRLKFTLLNCRDDIYCCLESGEIFKYVFELNRWMRFSQPEQDQGGIRFASDGNELYKMFISEQTDNLTIYASQMYSFQENLWISIPTLPDLTRHLSAFSNSTEQRVIREFVFVRNYGFAALFKENLFLLNHESQLWQHADRLPYHYSTRYDHSVVSQSENDHILCVLNNKLYLCPGLNRDWQLKKKLKVQTFKRKSFWHINEKYLPYRALIGIHVPFL